MVFALAVTKTESTSKFSGAIKPVVANLQINNKTELPSSQSGLASWYTLGLSNPELHTCASTKFAIGTYLLVKNQRNGLSVVCLVDDYGPTPPTNRVIDLSRGCFGAIEDLNRVTTLVEIRPIPSPPVGINLPFPTSFGQISGYRLCTQKFAFDWCEQNKNQLNKLSL